MTFAAGNVGQAFSLDGVNDYVRVPQSVTLDPGTGSFTLAAWIRTSAMTDPQDIFSKYECGLSCPSTANSAYDLYLSASGTPHFDMRDSDGAAFQTISGSSSVADGAWHLVAASKDMAAGTMNLYADGALVASSPLGSGANGRIGDDDGEPDPLIIGAQYVGGSSALTNFFSGRIDEAMYFNRALTPAEILSVSNSATTGLCRCTDVDGDGYGSQGGASCPNGTQ